MTNTPKNAVGRGKKGKAVVLLSGGIDSSTTLAIAQSEGYELYALSFDYRQRHVRELESARAVARSLAVRNHLVIAFDLREIGGSALTSEMEVPKSAEVQKSGSAEEKNTPPRLISELPNFSASGLIPVTYVPARNTIFLSFALAWAEVLGASDIFIGANAVDYSGYPDCRPGYLKAFEDMANLATKVSVEGNLRFRINAPLLSMTKEEIIRKGVKLGLDYSLTWSCYDPQEKVPASAGRLRRQSSKLRVKSSENSELRTFNSELIPCGKCDSCRFRGKGFKAAGIKDPLLSLK
jgi:7-cyano-7-deazaguanine synthase